MSGIHRNRVELTCQTCGKNFLANLSDNRRRGGVKFCSRPCHHAAQAIPLQTHFRRGVGQTTENGCILWAGIKDHQGRGIIYSSTHRRGQRVFRAHRVAWELARGPIPLGQCVLHVCDQPACVNVAHLFLGTHRDNMADMVAKNRSPNRKLTPEQVRTIRDRYAQGGATLHQLGEEYGVSHAAISLVVRRKTYANVT